MKALNRRLLRELWRIRGQALAVACVIASGVAVLVMSLSTLEALDATAEAYYERNRFAELFATAVRAPVGVAARIAKLPGVQAVEARIERYATLDITGFQEPAIGRLSSIPERGQPTLNRLVLRSGRWIEPYRPDEVVINEPFSEAHDLNPGDEFRAVINGRRRVLTVVGTALSPEFVYALGPGALMPDDRRFGVVWMGRDALESAYDLKGAFNDLSVVLARDATPGPIMVEIDRLLAPFGGVSAIERANQLSNWFLMNEIEQLKTLSTILPAIFIGVAAFLTYMILTRLVATEASEIGLLKAFGYSHWEVSWHYTKLVIAIALVGIAIGSVFGVAFGLNNTRMYAELFHFPLLIYRPGPATFLIAAGISITATLCGALSAVRRAARLPPAEAMRPPQPTAYRRGRLSAVDKIRGLDQPTRIALRQIGRWPLRSAFTSVGIAMAIGLLIMALQWHDAIAAIAERYFFDAQRQSLTVGLADPQALNIVEDFKRLPGVMVVEPMRIASADLFAGRHKHRGAITAITHDAQLQPIRDDANGVDIPVPRAGIMLATRLAAKLGVALGDNIRVEVHEGRRPSVSVPVTGVFETLIGMPAYMHLDTLNRLLRVRPSLEYVNLLTDRNAESALFTELKSLPNVSAVTLKRAAVESFYATIGEQMLIFTGIFTVFAGALGFGVVYNSTRIALSERGRELATLRVLGFTRGEISYILLAEVALLIVAALPLGCAAGHALVYLIAAVLDTELYRLPLVVEPSTYGYAVILTLLASAASAALVGRRIARLDLIRVLKTRE